MHEQLTKWWNGVSLRTKVTSVTVLLVTLGLLVAGVGTMSVLRNYLLAESDSKIRNYALDLKDQGLTPEGACRRTAGPGSHYVATLNPDGSVICTNRSDEQLQPAITVVTEDIVAEQAGAPITLWDEAHTQQWRIIAVEFDTEEQGPVTLTVGLSLADTNGIIGQYSAIFLGFGLAVIVLGAALTRILVTTTFQPLREVEATAAAIADGDFSQRLPGATPNTEVGRLNRSLNTMLNRIDRAFADRARTIEQMRRFVGDASHELRTPLVSVRGYAELYRLGALQSPEEVGQAMGRIEKEAQRMGELVEDLLSLARLDEAKPLQLAPVDLLPLAHDAALDAMASDPERFVTVHTLDPILATPPAQPAPAPVATTSRRAVRVKSPTRAPARVGARSSDRADKSDMASTGPIAFAGAQWAKLRARRAKTDEDARPTPSTLPAPLPDSDELVARPIILAEENKIRQVIANLMGNAMRFTPHDSPIELVVQVNDVRGVVHLDIVDHGEGIPPQIRERIFQRFWRADNSRTRETGGSGLGLAIVAGIVAAHHGSVDVLETPGGGATMRVTLPLLPSEPEPETADS